MATTYEKGDLPNGAHRLLQGHPQARAALPHPDLRWRRRDQPDVLVETLPSFRRREIVEVAGRYTDQKSPANIYRTSEAAHAYIQRLDDPVTPCGHPGVTTIEPRETYSCATDDCDERFGPETAREEMTR